MTQFKGPVFASYRNPGAGGGMHKVWPPGHHGMRQRLRHLRHAVRPLLDSKDPAVMVVSARLIAAVKDEPNPEYSALHLAGAAIDAARERQQSWTDAMTFILDEFDRRHNTPDATFALDAYGRPILLPEAEAHGASS